MMIRLCNTGPPGVVVLLLLGMASPAVERSQVTRLTGVPIRVDGTRAKKHSMLESCAGLSTRPGLDSHCLLSHRKEAASANLLPLNDVTGETAALYHGRRLVGRPRLVPKL